jgi:hypothetical protein
VAYLKGQVPGQPPIDRRMYATKRIAVGKMYARLANMRALWWQAFSEAKGFPTKAEVMRMYAAQYNVMEGAQEMTAWPSAPAAGSRCCAPCPWSGCTATAAAAR